MLVGQSGFEDFVGVFQVSGLEEFFDSEYKIFCVEDSFFGCILLDFNVNVVIADFSIFLLGC